MTTPRRLRFLLPSTPIYGHVSPMVTLGQGLLARGHQVTVLTGAKYRPAVAAAGLDFWPLPDEVDYDDARLDDLLPGRSQLKGVARARHDILALFVRPLPAQSAALQGALAALAPDAVVAETAFLGALPLLLREPPTERVPVVGVSATPLSLTSVDCAPFGSGLGPGRTAHTRRRNRFIHLVLHAGPLRPIQTGLDAALAEVGAPAAPGTYFDVAAMFDVTFQLAVPGLEYPRRELPPTLRFVGPLLPETSPPVELPPWWSDLNGDRPVVHVTQGTMANDDLGQLLAPTIRGLAGEDVLVVAATGRRPVADLLQRLGGSLPGNARVAEFLPYAELLSRVDVYVTNGGFGGVQQALSHGLPLVVAGATEDKPEVAGRVAWSGAGVNLYTGLPSPAAVRRGVTRVLREPRYRAAAAALQQQIAGHADPVGTIATELEALVGLPADAAG